MINKQIPAVSVLMPAYNAEKYIGDAIESILKQSFKDFELIIVNDASTDNTLKIIQKFVKKDKRVKVYENKKNLYIAAARNKLIKLAKGEYIAWQDADDISMAKRLEHQYSFLENHTDVGIVGGFLQFFNDKTGNTSVRKYAAEDKELRGKIFRYSPVAQPTAMIRRKILNEVGDYNLKYPPAEDIDMSFRIGKKYKFANLKEVTLRYRENEASATFNKLKKIELSTIEIRNKYSKQGYEMTFIDKLYNVLQFISIYIIPPKLKIKMFNLIRNNR